MTPLFVVAIALTSLVIVGLALTLRALQRRAHAEAVDRLLFDEFDAALARRLER